MEAQETAPAPITTTLPATAAGGDLSPKSNHVDDGRFAKGNRAGLSTRFEPGTSGNPGGGKVGAAYPSRWLPALGDLSEAELNVVAKDKKASVSKRAAAMQLLDMFHENPDVRRRAFAQVCDRTEGRAVQKTESTVTTTHALRSPEEVLAELNRLANYGAPM